MTSFPPPTGRSIVGRADLLLAMASGRNETVAAVATRLGLELRAEEPRKPIIPEIVLPPLPPVTLADIPDSKGYPNQIEDIALWQVIRYEQRQELNIGKADDSQKPIYWGWTNPPERLPEYQPVASWRVIRPRLQAALDPTRQSLRIDMNKLIRRIAQREFVRRIPRLESHRWNGRLFIVADRSAHLIPFFADQDLIARHLLNLLPKHTVSRLEGHSPFRLFADPSRQEEESGEFLPQQPAPGSRILVLGDLGSLARSRSAWIPWFRWGRESHHRGCELIALVPCAVSRLPRTLLNLFRVQSWQGNAVAEIRDDEQRQKMVEKLLTLAAPAVRLEPGLLRDLRRLLPEAADASLESDVWSSSLLSSDHPVAATIDRQIAKRHLRPKFESLPVTVRAKALNVIRKWRKLLEDSPEIWLGEFLDLSESSRNLLPASDLQDARAALLTFDEELSGPHPTPGLEEFADRLTRRASDYAMSDSEVGWILRKYQRMLNPDMGIHSATDPREVPPGDREVEFHISLDDQALTIQPKHESEAISRSIISVRSSNSVFEIAVAEGWTESNFWKAGKKPSFVSDFGTDQYGAWFAFQVPHPAIEGHNVTQRMRWIPAGNFMMGSPPDEDERLDGEGPQHRVTLTQGFWLADTPCTQEMWEAVTGQNPSHFKGAQLPVETVSWNDTRTFIEQLGRKLSGLELNLPSEAQWEYACRAGSETRYSFGDELNPTQANVDREHGETSEVKAYPANAWGLHDVHGNVWQWCRDGKRVYESHPAVDPLGPGGSSRVIRGGCWFYDARYARSASRYWFGPGFRYYYLGFRLLSSAPAEPTVVAQVPVAEQGSERTRVGAAGKNFAAWTVKVSLRESTRIQIGSRTGSLAISTDREELRFNRLTRPAWAVEFGRDPFGVYADFEVASVTDDPSKDKKSRRGKKKEQPARSGDARSSQAAVRQRMRWIPPGIFLMGSPEDEPGRYENETLRDVTITAGFWMFDSPCTQRLWSAVMDDNPSYFPDPDRPVEQVDWDQAAEFATRLTDRLNGPQNEPFQKLEFRLPTEAQWEYACRADTSTAIYTGPLEILGNANAPALDAIAWYGGNSGHQYDHQISVDVSKYEWLSEKQYSFTQAGTRRVKEKVPNRWGLYDMLGNVWEWCSDRYNEGLNGSRIDPQAPETGSGRVIRGGGWFDSARYARSAYRNWDDPGDRDYGLGFRLLSSASQEREAERESGSRTQPRDEAVENQRTK